MDVWWNYDVICHFINRQRYAKNRVDSFLCILCFKFRLQCPQGFYLPMFLVEAFVWMAELY